jgi:hypothetical protein
MANSTALKAPVGWTAAAGNTTTAVVGSGETSGNTYSSTTSVYTYSGATMATGTGLQTPRRMLCAESTSPGGF